MTDSKKQKLAGDINRAFAHYQDNGGKLNVVDAIMDNEIIVDGSDISFSDKKIQKAWDKL